MGIFGLKFPVFWYGCRFLFKATWQSREARPTAAAPWTPATCTASTATTTRTAWPAPARATARWAGTPSESGEAARTATTAHTTTPASQAVSEKEKTLFPIYFDLFINGQATVGIGWGMNHERAKYIFENYIIWNATLSYSLPATSHLPFLCFKISV